MVSYSMIKFRNIETPNCSYSPFSVYGGSHTIWDVANMPEHLFAPIDLGRKSRCELEIDVLASDIIINSTSGKIHQNFTKLTKR